MIKKILISLLIISLFSLVVIAGGGQNTEMINNNERPETSTQVTPGINDETGDQTYNSDDLAQERDETKNFLDRFD